MIQVRNALDVFRRLNVSTVEELESRMTYISDVDRWLEAEHRHKANIEEWLRAEAKWTHHQWVSNNLQVYGAAAAGWLKMREVAPRLDGAPNFASLGIGLQQRYARFAAGVLEYIGIDDDGAWAYVDEGEA